MKKIIPNNFVYVGSSRSLHATAVIYECKLLISLATEAHFTAKTCGHCKMS
jgi:hypothetical protein